MTSDNSTPATEPGDAVPEDTDNRSTAEQSDDGLDPAGRKLSDEAAKWRVQARAEETNRLIAEAKLAGVQTREVNRLLRMKVAEPQDFWLLSEAKLEDLLGPDGEVDEVKVAEAADAVVQARPHWAAKLGPVGAPSAAVTGDGKYDVPATEQPSWDALLRGKTAG